MAAAVTNNSHVQISGNTATDRLLPDTNNPSQQIKIKYFYNKENI